MSDKPATAPTTSICLSIPENCRMAGEFASDRDIRIEFGDSEETIVVFERFALDRFARLAYELLAAPDPEESSANLARDNDPGASTLMVGENSAFIQELNEVGDLVGAYAGWALDPDTTAVGTFPFEEQMLLSARLAALGHTMRELAYARMAGNEEAAEGVGGEERG